MAQVINFTQRLAIWIFPCAYDG